MDISPLLQRSEGDTLDFKRDNYRFVNATEEEKSELLKDILALANAWKATDAHIIIGVEERNGRATDVIGVTPELNDSQVQQFVNSKTNRPVGFAIEHTRHRGKPLTIIRVNRNQTRPMFLTTNYGRLKKNVVYVRHGSSTDEASPDEIAEMARSDVAVPAPDVQLACRIVKDAYCYRQEPSIPFADKKPTYFDGFQVIVRNEGTALAQHIEGSLQLPRCVFSDYFNELKSANQDVRIAVAKSKPVKLEFSNYLREPPHHYLAKPNPLEWKPLLPGRELKLLSRKAIPLRERFLEVDAKIIWSLAVDNCPLRTGEMRFREIAITGDAAE